MSQHLRPGVPGAAVVDLDPEQTGDWRIYLRLLGYLRAHLPLFMISLAGFVVYALGNVLLADVFGYLLDTVNDTQAQRPGLMASLMGVFPDSHALQQARVAIPAALIGFAVLRSLGFFAGALCIQIAAQRVVHCIRCELFDQLLALPVQVLDTEKRGTLVARITFTVDQVAGAVTKALKTTLRESLVVCALLGYMLYLNWQLSLLFLLIAPPIALIVQAVGVRFRRTARRLQSSMGDLNQVTVESVDGYRQLRMDQGEQDQADHFRSVSHANQQHKLRMALIESAASPLIQTVLALALAVLAWLALSPTLLLQFSGGQFAAFLIAALQLGKPLRQLSGVQAILQQGLAAAEDIFAHLDHARETRSGSRVLSSCDGRVQFDEVSFTYPDAVEPALCQISLLAESGQTVALVGPSGAGKSTLIQLLCGLYQADSGTISIDNCAIDTLALSDLRSHLAVVSQAPVLFNDSVYNNIAGAGLRHATKADVLDAASVAGADEFIDRLPDGYDTVIGDHAQSLSGGQKQRIALARAVLKRAPVLILDEATSALDTVTEEDVMQRVKRAAGHSTLLVIAHRLSTVERADHIVVLEQGRVIACGNHQHLLASCALYQRLCQQSLVA